MIAQVCKRGRVRLLSWLAMAMMAAAHPASGQVMIAPDCRLEVGPTRAVARVIDGETVRLDDGSEVRLIGALAPRAADVGASSHAWPPEQAAIQALTDLVQGRSVVLWFGGRRTDRYGRALAHIVVDRHGGQEWVQGAMLEQGMARAYVMPDNAACVDALIARERPARDAHRGLWANAAYRVRAADRPEDLGPLRHTYQLVSGIILRASRARDQIYLNFAAHGRAGFSVRLRPSAKALPAGVEPKDLRGRLALVRGWVEQRGGPFIDIDTPGQLELMDAAAEPGSGAGRAWQKDAPGGHAAGRR
jgi:micrococcal nuclease